MMVQIEDASGEEIKEKKVGGALTTLLFGEVKGYYKYGLNVYDPDGKALFWEYDRVEGYYNMNEYNLYPQKRKQHGSEGWIYPDRNEIKRREMITKKVNEWAEKGFKASSSDLQHFINDRTTDETLILQK